MIHLIFVSDEEEYYPLLISRGIVAVCMATTFILDGWKMDSEQTEEASVCHINARERLVCRLINWSFIVASYLARSN